MWNSFKSIGFYACETSKEGLIDFFSFTGDTQLLWHHFNYLKALERQYNG